MTCALRALPARFVIFAAALLTFASGAAAQAPDRSVPPKLGPPPSLKPPPIQKRTLSNGVTVWITELHEVPVAQIDLIAKLGSAADPAGKFGLGSLTTTMMDEGAGSRTALEIADAVDLIGATLSTSSSYDASSVRLHTPVGRLDEALSILADVALRPTFPASELERLRRERLTALLQARDDPAAIISYAFPRLVFGQTHRYGTVAGGTADALKSFTVADLKQFHEMVFQPANASLVVVGDVTPDQVTKSLEQAFGAWKQSGPSSPVPPVANAPQRISREVFLIDKPGAAQSAIRIGWVGVPRSTPDFFALQVLNTILGGSFTSRLNQNLRETHGYAYGAGSAFDMRAAAGPFFAAANVQTDKTAEALKEFFNELNGILQPVPNEELQKAKNYLALSFPAEFESSGDIAGALTEVIVYNLPENYFSTYVERIQQVTSEDVRRLAARYIQPDKLAVVVVGDLKTIEAPVRALNLGPVRIVPLDEMMGKAPEINSAQ